MIERYRAVKGYGILVLIVLLVGTFTSCGADVELAQGRQAAGSSKSIVLVHGAWMGGWGWDRVAQYLRDQGHTVVAVTLPAHDTDPLPAPAASLAGYVDVVAAAVHSVPGPAYLVGHSAGGVVISQFAENEPAAVKQLIYVAAILPQSGQTLFDLASLDQGSLILPNMTVDMTNYVVSLPVSQVPAILCGDCNPSQAQLLQSHYRDEPLLPAATPVSLTAARFGAVDKRYFFMTQDQTVTYPRQQAMASTVTLTKTASMNSYHCPQLTRSSEFSDKLLVLMK